MKPTYVKDRIITIGGFTESERKWTGSARLNKDLWGEFGGRGIYLHYKCWNDNFYDLANRIYNEAEKHNGVPDVRLIINSYSWGFGYGACKALLPALREKRIRVAHLNGCDPVYYSRLICTKFLAVAGWHIGHRLRNLTAGEKSNAGWPPIKIPSNVDEVNSCRQENDTPRGSMLVAEGKHTIIHPPILVPTMGHSVIDDSKLYHNMVKKSCRAVFE